jgi:antitoxin (DNA-binding transcriptional repressor) of toxin-antitoxin stability system
MVFIDVFKMQAYIVREVLNNSAICCWVSQTVSVSRPLNGSNTLRYQQSQLTPFVHTCTLEPMRLSISEARKRLPELVRRVRKDTGTKVEITVRDEVVAELRATLPEPEPGAAARKLVQLMRRLPKHRGRKTKVSLHIKEHLHSSVPKSR